MQVLKKFEESGDQGFLSSCNLCLFQVIGKMSRFDGSKGPPTIEGMTSLKVDNLTYRTNIDDLDRYFSKYGDVGDIYIPRDRYKRESRGFAFVRYHEKRDAEDAIDSLDGTIIDGRQIRVTLAKYDRPTENFAPRGRGAGRYGGGGGRYDRRSPPRRGYRDRYDRDRYVSLQNCKHCVIALTLSVPCQGICEVM